MDFYDLERLEKKVSRHIDEKRMAHSLSVKDTAACLAMKYGYEAGLRGSEHGDFIKRAMLAGILHDNAKCMKDNEMLKACEEAHIYVSACEKNNPSLLHAKLGAFYASEIYGIGDKEVISAIECHTTGKENMSLLEKILFVADYIEPLRSRQPRLDEVRCLAFTALDACVYRILEDTLEYLEKNGTETDVTTIKVRDYYRKAADKYNE